LKKDPKEWNNLYENDKIKELKAEMTEIIMARLSAMHCLTLDRN
jgi:hypothetical protein